MTHHQQETITTLPCYKSIKGYKQGLNHSNQKGHENLVKSSLFAHQPHPSEPQGHHPFINKSEPLSPKIDCAILSLETSWIGPCWRNLEDRNFSSSELTTLRAMLAGMSDTLSSYIYFDQLFSKMRQNHNMQSIVCHCCFLSGRYHCFKQRFGSLHKVIEYEVDNLCQGVFLLELKDIRKSY